MGASRFAVTVSGDVDPTGRSADDRTEGERSDIGEPMLHQVLYSRVFERGTVLQQRARFNSRSTESTDQTASLYSHS